MKPGRLYRCGMSSLVLVLAVRSARLDSTDPDDVWVALLEWRTTRWLFGQWILGHKHWNEVGQ